jgi:DNA-directed RNA polymerase specialized sigma24 family protein
MRRRPDPEVMLIVGRVRGYLLRRFPDQVDDVDDLDGWIAEHVLVAIRKFDRSRSSMPLSAWCCLCARSRMLDSLRRRRISTVSYADAEIE